jgi:purine-binding chemotaxis protein CheW
VVQVVAFEIDRQRFGLPTEAVERVVRAVATTPAPKAPAGIAGIINVAGEPVAVLDLRRRLGLRPRPVALDESMILARVRERRVAIRAERVTGIVDVEPADLRAADRVAAMASEVAGVLALPEGLLLINDPDAFLSQAEAAELDRLAADP